MNNLTTQADAKKNMSFYHLFVSYYKFVRHNLGFAALLCKRYKNPIFISYLMFRKRYPIPVTLRNGTKLECEDFNSLYNQLLNLDYDSTRGIVHIGGCDFHGGKENGDNLSSIFINKEYDFLPVRGKSVIDVGANIADSAIYFALSGAERVIGVEPNRSNYDLAKLNIEANHFSNKIKVIFASCSSKDSETDGSSPESVSIQSIINMNNIRPSILKIDCEGCEYDIILNTPPEVLYNFEYIQIEYHYGYKSLKEKLQSLGFNVDVTSPRYLKSYTLSDADISQYGLPRNNSVFCGWLYASRVKTQH